MIKLTKRHSAAFALMCAVSAVVVAGTNGCSSSSGSGSPQCCKTVEDAGGGTITTCGCAGSAMQGGTTVTCSVQTSGSSCSLSCTINGQTTTSSGGMLVSSCQ